LSSYIKASSVSYYTNLVKIKHQITSHISLVIKFQVQNKTKV